MPTLSALDLRLKRVTDQIEQTNEVFKKKYTTKSFIEERFEAMMETFEQSFITKQEFRDEFANLETSLAKMEK